MMRRFELVRSEDVSGVSGTGIVADGVLFDDALVALHWPGDNPTVTTHINGIPSVDTIHGHGGKTVVRWVDGPDAEYVLIEEEVRKYSLDGTEHQDVWTDRPDGDA